MEPAGAGRSLRAPPPPPPLLLLLLLLQVAGPAGTVAETLLDASRAMGSSSSPPSPASVVAPGTTPFEESRLPVFTLDYPHVQIPFEITLWILLASLAKIGERAGPASWGGGDRKGTPRWVGVRVGELASGWWPPPCGSGQGRQSSFCSTGTPGGTLSCFGS